MRTGYEYVMPHKVSDKFCVSAEEDGVVTEISDKLIIVKYKSGKEVSYPAGIQYGNMEGSIYTHELISDLKTGSKFKKNEALVYHKDFFERDWLDKTKLVMKSTAVTTVALTMNNEVFEDSSAISRKFAGVVTTELVHTRTFLLEFNNNIIELLPVGTKVGPEDILFMALDETNDGGNLSSQSIAMLQNLAALSPRAKMDGVIDRIEIKYNGDLNDMSPTVKKLAVKLDRDLFERTKGTEYESKTNKVTAEYRSSGKSLNLDTFELKVFIRVPLRMNIGDKLVFANQMKSVVGEVFTYDIHTESGDEVNAMFSYQGVINRVVNSPIVMGTTNRIVRHISKRISETYFKK